MKIAIFGSNSSIADEFIEKSIKCSNIYFDLYTRKKDLMTKRMSAYDSKQYRVLGYDSFTHNQRYDLILNFIGCGDPKKLIQAQKDIIQINDFYDNKIIQYLIKSNTTKYVYLSSGVAYHVDFECPIESYYQKKIIFSYIKDYHHYGIAKNLSEIRHRAYSDLAIVDLRIFSYLRDKNLELENSLMGNVFSSIYNQTILTTIKSNVWRDYIDADLFYQAINCIINNDHLNGAFDLYSAGPVDKMHLLKIMEQTFGLRYKFLPQEKDIKFNSTGLKPRYYSLNNNFSILGYTPKYSSEQLILKKAQKSFGN